MGETRLWYSFFMGIAGLLTYIRWQYRWILSFSALLATVFVIINLMKPEIHDLYYLQDAVLTLVAFRYVIAGEVNIFSQPIGVWVIDLKQC